MYVVVGSLCVGRERERENGIRWEEGRIVDRVVMEGEEYFCSKGGR